MKKNIFKICFVLVSLGLVLSGCSFNDITSDKLKWLDEKASALFNTTEDENKQSVIEFMEGNSTGFIPGIKKEEVKKEETNKEFTQEQKAEIDAWLERKNFNRYGDSAGAIYPGGTPLFNEETGVMIDRYDYILNKFPNILERIEEE